MSLPKYEKEFKGLNTSIAKFSGIIKNLIAIYDQIGWECAGYLTEKDETNEKAKARRGIDDHMNTIRTTIVSTSSDMTEIQKAMDTMNKDKNVIVEQIKEVSGKINNSQAKIQ